ncbi:MAG: SAP domain-containing protein, partial [Candidatus Methanoplasma sp.]|nr:SAP domain-containing protein [Candidatus Methanoplasma sp.]
MNSEDLRNNYYLKSELAEFCRSEGISAHGGKPELTERIAHYLDTGEESPPRIKKRSRPPETLDIHTNIEYNITCSEKHREFFRTQIGEGFKFNTEFMKWLRDNPGKTYGDAV